MAVYIGNFKIVDYAGNKEKLAELTEKLKELGYERTNTADFSSFMGQKKYHCYDIPRMIVFGMLDDKAIALLKEYSKYFNEKVQVGISTK